MAKTVTIELSQQAYEALSDRAAREGLSVAEWIERDADDAAQVPAEELLAMLRTLPPIDLGGMTGADLVREGRDERADQIIDAVTGR